MKFTAFIVLLTLIISGVQASDVSCQNNLMKPKINPTLIITETKMPADLTVAEAQSRLKNTQHGNIHDDEQENVQKSSHANNEKTHAKKESRLGGIFDILLPSKLRNPVK